MIRLFCFITAFLVSFNEPFIDDIVGFEYNFGEIISDSTDISNNETISYTESDISENEIIFYSPLLTSEPIEIPDYTDTLHIIEYLLLILVLERVVYIAWDLFNFGGKKYE